MVPISVSTDLVRPAERHAFWTEAICRSFANVETRPIGPAVVSGHFEFVEIGRVKQLANVPIYAPDREKAVMDKVRRLNRGPLQNRCLEAVYRELMSGSFALEKPLRIAYLGPEGTFSHAASVRKFGSSVDYVPLADIPAVFEEVAFRGVLHAKLTRHVGATRALAIGGGVFAAWHGVITWYNLRRSNLPRRRFPLL